MLTGQHPPHHAFGLAACFPGVVAVGWWEKVSQLLPRAGRPQLPCPGRRHLSPPLPSPGFAFPVPGPGHNLHCEWWFPPPPFLQTHTPRTHVYFGKEEESFQALLRVMGAGQSKRRQRPLSSLRSGAPGPLPTQMRADPNPRTAGHAPARGPAALRWRHAAFLLTSWNRRPRGATGRAPGSASPGARAPPCRTMLPILSTAPCGLGRSRG